MTTLWSEIRSSTEQAVLENKDTAKMFPLTPHCHYKKRETNHSCINGSRSLRSSVGLHHTETTGAWTPERIAKLYEVFNDDMPGNLSELHNEVDHWKAI